MRRAFILGLSLTLLAGCGGFADSRINPLNWFGKAKDEAAQTAPSEYVDPALLDTRPFVNVVSSFIVERVPGGAIIRAEGQVPTQGYFGAQLVPLADEQPVDGSLVYLFRVQEPITPQPVGSDANRTLSVGRFVANETLSTAQTIIIRGAQNQLRSRR